MDAKELLGAFTEQETAELVAALPDEVLKEEAARRGLVSQATGSMAVADRVETTQDVKVDLADVKELLLGQPLDIAFSGYKTVAEQINAGRKTPEQFETTDPETMETELRAWLTDEKAEQAIRLMESDPELTFSLVATPNVVVAPSEAITLAEEFGKNQPYRTYIYDHIVKSYSSEQLSGTNPDNGKSVQFSLIPNKLNHDLFGTVAAQRAALAKLQTDMPDLRVPSLLENMTYWQTLRSQGDDLAHGDVFERTYIRHFDLPRQRVDGYDYVLNSDVSDRGKPLVDESDVRGDYYGRALVG